MINKLLNHRFSKPLLLVLAVVTIFGAGFWARAYYDNQMQQAASKVASQFISETTTGDITKAYRLTGDAIQKQQDETAFKEAWAGMKSEQPVTQPAMLFKQDGVVFYAQKVSGLAPAGDGSTSGTYYLTLKKEGNNWKVASATVR